MKSEFEKTIPNGTVNADKIFEALRTWVAQSEKELATLRAENARLKLAHENTWQALSRMVAKYEDVHTPAFLAFDEDFLAGRVALSSTKSDPLYAAAPEMLEALKAIAGIEAWINDNEMKAHFQKTVYGAIKAAELELRREELEKEVEPMSDEAYEAAISGVSDDHPGMD